MHIDTEHLALSVLKTSRALKNVYEKHGAKSSVSLDLFRIYLLQYVLDENSLYPAHIREQSLVVLREKIEQKEYIGLGNIETDPQTVSRTLNNIAAELNNDLKSITHLIDQPDLNTLLDNWKNFIVAEKMLHHKFGVESPHWVAQVSRLLKNLDIKDSRTEQNIETALRHDHERQIETIKSQIRKGVGLESAYQKAEEEFLKDVRSSFNHIFYSIQSHQMIDDEIKKEFWAKVDKSLERYHSQSQAQDFTVSIQQFRNKTAEPEPKPRFNRTIG